MRSFIVMAMFATSLAQADWSDYEEVQELDVDAAGASSFFIDAGAGSMVVKGGSSSDSIKVTATIQVDTGNDEKAQKIIAEDLTLSLDREGDRVVLKSFFDNGGWGDSNGSVRLEVEMPAGISLRVDDGSGSMIIEDIEADVEIDDGSGSLKVYNVGSLEIEDGSGSIDIRAVTRR